jgi:hypothetical protein
MSDDPMILDISDLLRWRQGASSAILEVVQLQTIDRTLFVEALCAAASFASSYAACCLTTYRDTDLVPTEEAARFLKGIQHFIDRALTGSPPGETPPCVAGGAA